MAARTSQLGARSSGPTLAGQAAHARRLRATVASEGLRRESGATKWSQGSDRQAMATRGMSQTRTALVPLAGRSLS